MCQCDLKIKGHSDVVVYLPNNANQKVSLPYYSTPSKLLPNHISVLHMVEMTPS